MPAEGRKRGTRPGDRRTDGGAPHEAPPAEAAVASGCGASTTSTSTSVHDDGRWEEVGGKNRHHRGGTRKQQQQQQQQRPSPKPLTKPRGMGDGASRHQPARSASRREYTLFDHLVANSAPRPRRSGSGMKLSLDGGGGDDGPTPKQTCIETVAGTGRASRQRPPTTRGHVVSTPAPCAVTSGTTSKEPQRGPASQQSRRRGAPTSSDRAGIVALLRGGGGSGTEAGRRRESGPSLPSSAWQQQGGRLPRNRVVARDSDARKPGKQRLGPRNKKLSSLKKKILLDRLEKWREIWEKEGPPLALATETAPADHAGEQGAPSSSLLSNLEEETSASLFPPTGTPRGCQTKLWVIAIYNLVEAEDVEDGDDHAEVERDLREMASTFGAVHGVEVPRDAAHFDSGAGGPPPTAAAKVAFESAEEAQRAKLGFHGRVVGGKSLRVEIIEDADNLGGGAGRFASGIGASSNSEPPAVWRVAVENLIGEEDDVDDEDEYAELCADISAMMGAHGSLVEVDIPRGGRHGNGIDSSQTVDGSARMAAEPEYIVVVAYGSQAEAQACAKDTNGRRLGGKELKATLIAGKARVGSESSGNTKQRQNEPAAISAAAGCEGIVRRAGTATVASPSADAKATSPAGGGTTRPDTWRVVVRNLVDEEDLVDDDDYGELRSDITALVSEYGAMTRLCIPRDRKAAGEEAVDVHDGGGEPGEAVAVFGSLEEAEACARGLRGRKIAGKILDAQVSQNPSQLGVEARAGAEPGNDTPPPKQQPTGATPAQRGRPSVASELYGFGSGVVRGVDPPEAGARAGAQSSGGIAPPASMNGGKRMPTKYKEAAALPKPPGVCGVGSLNAYVNQSPDKEVDDLVFEMLQILFKFQERARLADPAKSKTRRRLVMGLREVLRGVKAAKVRLLIVAPNVDAVEGKGGLDEKVVEIIDAAREGETPVVFALSRRKIGKALGKTIKVSAVGVYSFDGAHEHYKQLKRRIEAIHALPHPSPLGGDKTEVLHAAASEEH